MCLLQFNGWSIFHEGDAPGKIDMVRRYYQDIFLLLPEMPVKTF
jgi:hypothetical protein